MRQGWRSPPGVGNQRPLCPTTSPQPSQRSRVNGSCYASEASPKGQLTGIPLRPRKRILGSRQRGGVGGPSIAHRQERSRPTALSIPPRLRTALHTVHRQLVLSVLLVPAETHQQGQIAWLDHMAPSVTQIKCFSEAHHQQGRPQAKPTGTMPGRKNSRRGDVGFFTFVLVSQPVLTTSTYVVAWPQGDQFLGGGM